MDNSDIGELLQLKTRERGLNIKKLSDISGISGAHLESLLRGDFSKMPPAPYLYGYLKKLGDILGFDHGELWEELKRKEALKRSGKSDSLPKNRFERKIPIKVIAVFAVMLVMAVYFSSQKDRIFGKPIITVTYPDYNPVVAEKGEITMTGRLEGDGKLYVNGEAITVNGDGYWEKKIMLQNGINSFEISAKKTPGGETKLLKQILYNPPPASTTTTGAD
ncbi:MAG: helix-turn-helix domain-containing protein [Patescibacteria group bacterium]